ncbi:MAG: ABC transporter permease, partial [Muribaculaceae bacterium]|nr:ABC transporter permease [Muribaculaceae bacterium]
VVAVVYRYTDYSRFIIERLNVNEYFSFQGITSIDEAQKLLRAGKVDAVLIMRTEAAGLKSQIIVDASNTTIAQSATAYIQGVINGNVADTPIITSTLYNPQLKSSYNFVPGIMGMIFILICAIMTSVSIVREKENGTMALLLVSPVKFRTIILGKLVPYFLLSCIILAVMLFISYTLLGLPLSVSIFSVILISVIYILLSLSLGLLVSTIVNSQLTALIVSAGILMLPVIMLSGMIFPVDNMPVVLQWISSIVPARWYIEAMRKLMIQQLGIGYVIQELIILISMTIGLLLLSIKIFKTGK